MTEGCDVLEWDLGKYHISAKFSSANLLKAQIERGERSVDGDCDVISIWIRPDAWGRRSTCMSRSWFFFELEALFELTPPHLLKIVIKNAEAFKYLVQDGHVPVYCSESTEWKHINLDKIKIVKDLVWNGWDSYELEFMYDFANGDNCVWLAWSFPYDFDTINVKCDQVLNYCKQSGMLASKSTLCQSLKGRPIYIMRIAAKGDSQPERSTIILSARSQAGSTMSSYMFDGMLDVLVSQDPRGIALRNAFNWVCLPCLNPDGVEDGRTHADTMGQDLQRMYLGPSHEKQPMNAAFVDLVIKLRDLSRLFAVLDCNMSSEQKGFFLMANNLPDREEMVQNVLYAKLLANNCAYFDIRQCDFSMNKMRPTDGSYSPVGTQRSVFYSLTKLTHIYSLEGHFNSLSEVHPVNDLKECNLASLCIEPKWCMPSSEQKLRMMPELFHATGQAALLAFLDLKSINPVPRKWTHIKSEKQWAEDYLDQNDNLRQWYRPLGKKRPQEVEFTNNPDVVRIVEVVDKKVMSHVNMENEKERHMKMLMLGMSAKYAHVLCRDYANDACARKDLCPFLHLLPEEQDDIKLFKEALARFQSSTEATGIVRPLMLKVAQEAKANDLIQKTKLQGLASPESDIVPRMSKLSKDKKDVVKPSRKVLVDFSKTNTAPLKESPKKQKKVVKANSAPAILGSQKDTKSPKGKPFLMSPSDKPLLASPKGKPYLVSPSDKPSLASPKSTKQAPVIAMQSQSMKLAHPPKKTILLSKDDLDKEADLKLQKLKDELVALTKLNKSRRLEFTKTNSKLSTKLIKGQSGPLLPTLVDV